MLIWFLRKRRCHLCGTRLSDSPMVRACGWLHIFTPHEQQTAAMRVCMHCIVHQTDKGQQLCRPWFTCIWPKLEPGVKCDLFVTCFAPCSEDKDIYWAAHKIALLLTAIPTYCFFAVLLKWLKTSAVWHPPSFPLCFFFSSAHYSLSKINLPLLECFHYVSGYIQFAFTPPFWLVV